RGAALRPVEEGGGVEGPARDPPPLPAGNVASGLDVVVAVEQECRRALGPGKLPVESGRAAAVFGRQQRELEAEPSPEIADRFDHLGRDLPADRRDPEVAVEKLEPVVTRGHGSGGRIKPASGRSRWRGPVLWP